ncbi:uromodulin-like [Lissotriton helveticus]
MAVGRNSLSSAMIWVFLVSAVLAQGKPPGGITTDHVLALFDNETLAHTLAPTPARTTAQTPAPTTTWTTAQTPALPTPLRCSTNYPCQHGGTCKQGNCTCKNGFIGSYCEDIRVQLSCDENQMTVSVRKDVFDFYGTPTSVLHLNRANCKLQEVTLGGHIYMSAKLTHVNRTDCGTQIQVNGSHLIYSNQIQADLPPTTGMVVRSSNVSINFSCIFEYEKIASLPYSISAQQMKATFIVKEGLYTVIMVLYQTNKFLVPLVGLPSPIPLHDHLNVQLQLDRQRPHPLFVLTVRKCWATPTMNYSHAAQYTFIRDGCKNDSTMTFNDTQGTAVRFSIQMFRFVNYPRFYLHCQVRLCAPNATHNCLKNCWNGADWTAYRRRRSSDEDLNLYTRIVSIGPIKHAETMSQAKKPDSGMNRLLVPCVLAVGCVAGLFFLVAVAKLVKKHTGLELSSARSSNKL